MATCTWPTQALSSKGDCVTRPTPRRARDATRQAVRCMARQGSCGDAKGSYIGIPLWICCQPVVRLLRASRLVGTETEGCDLRTHLTDILIYSRGARACLEDDAKKANVPEQGSPTVCGWRQARFSVRKQSHSVHWEGSWCSPRDNHPSAGAGAHLLHISITFGALERGTSGGGLKGSFGGIIRPADSQDSPYKNNGRCKYL